MLEQWRAGLRVSEDLSLEVADLSLDVELPTIRVRSGKGRKARVVPVHPELGAAFQTTLAYGNVSEGRIIDAHDGLVLGAEGGRESRATWSIATGP